jgi:hypothetical protein
MATRLIESLLARLLLLCSFQRKAKIEMAKDIKAVVLLKVFPERAITTYGFIFGDDVKAPILTGPEATFRKTGKLDSAAMALLKTIMKE